MGHRPPDPCLRRQPALRHGVNEPQRTRRGATAAPCRPDTSTTLVAGIRSAPLFPPPTGPRRRERTGQTLTVSDRRGPGLLRHDRTDRARADACRCRDPRQRRARRRPALELTRSIGLTIRRETAPCTHRRAQLLWTGLTGSTRRWGKEPVPGAIPPPCVLGRDVAAADPAIDAQEVDAVGLAAENSLALRCQPQRESREDLSVAEWRGCG